MISTLLSCRHMETITQWLTSAYLFVIHNQVIIALVMIGSIFALSLRRFTVASKRSHRWRIKSAKRALKKLRAIESPAAIFSYLREMDAFVFEELLLTIFKELGCKVRRNSRYTGDGGVDGKIQINDNWLLIQAKRYEGSIRSSDVREFAALCGNENLAGLFIHTGKTPAPIWKFVYENSHVMLVSGQRLINLIKGKPGELF